MEQYRVNRVWVDDAHIWAETQNGWKANYPFSRWNRLANATPYFMISADKKRYYERILYP